MFAFVFMRVKKLSQMHSFKIMFEQNSADNNNRHAAAMIMNLSFSLQWLRASYRPKSPATRTFIQLLAYANNTKHIKAPHHGTVEVGIYHWPVDSLLKNQWCVCHGIIFIPNTQPYRHERYTSQQTSQCKQMAVIAFMPNKTPSLIQQ